MSIWEDLLKERGCFRKDERCGLLSSVKSCRLYSCISKCIHFFGDLVAVEALHLSVDSSQ